MNSFLKSIGIISFGMAACAVPMSNAVAQPSYPIRPITIVLPFAAGGSGDKFIRVLGPQIEKTLGKPLIVDYRPGGGNNIGTEYVARSKADGYTLLLQGVPFAVNPSLYKKLSWSIADFAPISLISISPYLIVVNPDLPVKSMNDFVQYAKHHAVNFASAGVGSGAHLAGALLNEMAGIQMNHIPYKSAPQAMTDLIGGSVQMFTSPLVSSMPMVEAGRVRALAVTGLKRTASMPDVPTVAESGLPGFEILSWYGVLAPKGTPGAIVDQLNNAFVAAMKDPQVIKALAVDEIELTPGTPQEFGTFIARTAAAATAIVKASGATVE